jgi:hypothetical protein
MAPERIIKYFFVVVLLGLCSIVSKAQVKLSGKVYDISKFRPLEAVSVLTNSGSGTITDSLGRFSIIVSQNDSVWFSYLNRPTPKYAVKAIPNINNFEISLHVNSTELKEVRVTPPNYKMDSIQNRNDYAKAFNFHKPGVGSSLNLAPGGGVGLDLDEFIGIFQFRKNRRMLAFQQRLMQEEEDRFIDHRFSRALVIKLTQMRGEILDTFMKRYRPTIDFVESSTDYELQDYIKKSFSHYQRYLNMMNQLKGK